MTSSQPSVNGICWGAGGKLAQPNGDGSCPPGYAFVQASGSVSDLPGFIGHQVGTAAGFIGNQLGTVGGAAGNAAGSAAGAITPGWAQSAGKALGKLTDPAFWKAAGLLVAGGVLVVLGAVLWFRKDETRAAKATGEAAALA